MAYSELWNNAITNLKYEYLFTALFSVIIQVNEDLLIIPNNGAFMRLFYVTFVYIWPLSLEWFISKSTGCYSLSMSEFQLKIRWTDVQKSKLFTQRIWVT